MKKASKIITLFVLVLSLFVVGAVFTASAAEGDIETEYGTVPAAYASNDFAVFHKAPGATEYTFSEAASQSTPFNLTTYALTGDVVMLMFFLRVSSS